MDYDTDDFISITITQFNELPKGTVLFCTKTNGFLIKGQDIFLCSEDTGLLQNAVLTPQLIKTQNLEKTVFFGS